ncbi:hypothetical protein TUM17576_35750 [Enterobacter hormaechei]|jgi:hypothetical protein|nr:hypothetical protein [Enterobacter hormaechei]MDU7134399.1 hypothetical protein [Enterobacteriaceae bacterium]PTA88763.1 hypothetical protein C9415_24530 [Kluyvera sp. Nf5]GJL41949.1 hypothetical protein TUM17577_31580 [Enterobacter asburiae]MDU7197350.1 hypothetical protein [Enterobacteriaceae bacterium]GJL36755.1 hypothetical protein TUM17576_35750 [Enterobacter hormaechei]
MNITLNKETTQLIDTKRYELLLKQGIAVSREEMATALLTKGAEIFVPELSIPAGGVGTTRPGVICLSADKPFSIRGILADPDPWDCARLLKEESALLMVVFGEPGCGVTTFIKKVLSLWTGDVDVFDEGNSDAVNIPAALKAVSIKRKAIVSMNARNIAEVEATLTRHIAPLN